MKNSVITPIFPKVFVSKTKKIHKASIKTSSPYPQAQAAFNWLNVDFPYPHTHHHWEIFIILKGKLKHTINDQQEIGSKGYACLIRPDDCHLLEYVEDEKDTQHINFTFSNELAQKLFEFYKEYPLNLEGNTPLHFFLENTFIDSIVQQVLLAQSLPKQTYEQHSMLLVHQLITIFIAQKLNADTAYPAWLNNFLYYLHNPECFCLSTTQLAANTPYSYSRLSRLFKLYLGKTLVEYINELKIVYAKRELRTTKKSVIDISLDLGYDSVSSFNHNFKTATSLTPTQYRKKYVARMPKN